MGLCGLLLLELYGVVGSKYPLLLLDLYSSERRHWKRGWL